MHSYEARRVASRLATDVVLLCYQNVHLDSFCNRPECLFADCQAVCSSTGARNHSRVASGMSFVFAPSSVHFEEHLEFAFARKAELQDALVARSQKAVCDVGCGDCRTAGAGHVDKQRMQLCKAQLGSIEALLCCDTLCIIAGHCSLLGRQCRQW